MFGRPNRDWADEEETLHLAGVVGGQDPGNPEGATGWLAPQGAGLAEEAGDNSQHDLPRPPARLRWRKTGETDFGCEGAAQIGKRGAGRGD